jgi:hypothetical protein
MLKILRENNGWTVIPFPNDGTNANYSEDRWVFNDIRDLREFVSRLGEIDAPHGPEPVPFNPPRPVDIPF